MAINIDELYLEAEADIKNNAFAEAYKKHEAILYEEPHHAPAHNSLGWLYKNQLDDYKRAEVHFLAAMKGDPLYPHPYFHYATLLTDLERYEELQKHLEHCLTIATIEKSWVYNKRAIVDELKLNLQEAIKNYEKAILVCLHEEKIKDYRESIDRCRSKLELSKQHTTWFGKFKL